MTDVVPESSRVVWINLEQGVDCLHMVQLMPTPSQYPHHLASFKKRLVLAEKVADKRV